MGKMNEFIEANKEIHKLNSEHWWDDVFLSFPCWFVIFSLIIPWVIWWKIVDKKELGKS
ncbi:hypothetical protein ACEWK1_20105 [Metabacillus sp. YM-086]|uniref:hypothetical protein n=1 Tax=Metabacillus sp. YM-086 TaxID=3341729 RepID=UPI001BA3E7A1